MSAARERSARRCGLSCVELVLDQFGDALGIWRAGDAGDPGEGGQRRGDHRQTGRQVLIDLHREDALGELVAGIGDQPDVCRPQYVRQLRVGAPAEQVDVRLG